MDDNITVGEMSVNHETDRAFSFAAAPKSLRQNLIRQGKGSEEAVSCAAIEIQRVWRGYRTRCNLFSVIVPKVSGTAIYGASQHHMARLQEVRTPSPDENNLGPGPPSKEALTKLYQDFINAKIQAGAVPQSLDILSFEDFCAAYTKSWWDKKGATSHKSPPAPAPAPHPSMTSVHIPNGSASNKPVPLAQEVRKKKREGPLTEHEAACSIQKAWRRHIDIQVYNYYRDLINFKCRGDPSLMLKCINPNEAKLLDPASGVHIKFRLAGERFPPNIYYKIFTHRPVVDLCACSPKDYTKAGAKQKLPRDLHNKVDRTAPDDRYDQDGWYQRIENNGWRLVSDRLITHALNDPVTWATTNKKVEFHHNKLQRRQDVEKKKKQKKIEWMKTMYKNGLLKARTEDNETKELIEGAAAGMVDTINREGLDAVQDWEVDELLDWTTSLNFDDYLSGWKEVATTAKSERVIEEKMHLFASPSDPFELTLSTIPSRHDETRQSHHTHNTPVGTAKVSGRRH